MPGDLRPDEVRRFLRLCASSEFRGPRRVPLSAVAVMCDLSRKTLYQIIMGGSVSPDVCTALTPLIRDIERGRLSFD
jgi:hypothetical protein